MSAYSRKTEDGITVGGLARDGGRISVPQIDGGRRRGRPHGNCLRARTKKSLLFVARFQLRCIAKRGFFGGVFEESFCLSGKERDFPADEIS